MSNALGLPVTQRLFLKINSVRFPPAIPRFLWDSRSRLHHPITIWNTRLYCVVHRLVGSESSPEGRPWLFVGTEVEVEWVHARCRTAGLYGIRTAKHSLERQNNLSLSLSLSLSLELCASACVSIYYVVRMLQMAGRVFRHANNDSAIYADQ